MTLHISSENGGYDNLSRGSMLNSAMSMANLSYTMVIINDGPRKSL